MDNQNYSQLELFSQDKTTTSPVRSKSFISYIRGYEKILITLIVFVIVAITAYSAGVEKGKRILSMKTYETMDLAMLKSRQPKSIVQATANRQNYTTSQALKTTPINTTEPSIQIAPVAETIPKIQIKTRKYTIQIASYQSKTGAQKEANILKKKGFQTTIISTGKFNIVCLGSFPDKQTASNMLTKLKQSYRDCSIRRL